MKDDIRIGVFICHCGGQISNILNIDRIVKALKKIDKVVHVNESDFPCSKNGLVKIRSAIEKNYLNRVVIAGCSHRLMEPFFSKVITNSGLNQNLFEIANIRDHVARVHQKEKSQATQKAIEIINGSIQKVARKTPLTNLSQKVDPTAAIIGGGIAGMSAALNLAHRGTKVKLIEKESQLGGLLNNINILYPRDISTRKFLKEKIQQIDDNSNIEVITNAEVKNVEGAVGDYNLTINENGKKNAIKAGAIIFAAGAQYFYPEGHYHYKSNDKVITQLEFERMLSQNQLTAKEIVFIQCVGSRNEQRPYCARFCCPTTFKNVIWLKKSNPDLKITVIFRGLTEYIREYDEALDLGVLFIRYDPKQPPEIEGDCVYVKDEKTDKSFEIPFDLMVLATPLIPRDEAKEWGKMLRLPVDEYGFIVEPHIKLRPDRFAPDGIFVAGSAHWAGMIGDSISQGYSAAARAYSLVQQEIIERQPIIAEIDPQVCRGCGKCIEECPFQAIAMIDEDDGFKHAEINELLCKGCGMCLVVCICGAASVKHLTDEELNVMIKGVMIA
ncbi:MAG: CoB--CoM heterodisulfide reductase iron-sulfur subunit A family protein [bacterium]|nr:MAG: CoB--CoM heterodisulfide reductase iron-sulfur subunit A family protein [bacterium]